MTWATVPLYQFRPPVGTPYGLEVTTLEEFFERHDPWPWDPGRPGRATFHYLTLITEGQLRHDVDHVTQTADVGQWLWVRPGHAQGWHRPGTANGPFILFEADVLSSHAAKVIAPALTHDAPSVLTPHVDDAAWLHQTALQLLDEQRALGRRPLGMHHALRRSLLEALLVRLASAPEVAASNDGGDTYARFTDILELRFRELHHADEYARLLGRSVRTLSRAARAATGKGTRELIDERRLLEAERLLAVDGWNARTVAAHLGFTDTANFGRFFRAHTGLTPATFAARTRAGEA